MPLKKAYGRNQNANVFDERFPHTEAPRHTFAIQDRLNGVCFSFSFFDSLETIFDFSVIFHHLVA